MHTLSGDMDVLSCSSDQKSLGTLKQNLSINYPRKNMIPMENN